MFSSDLKGLVIQVIKSWQVIAVTAALLLYLFLVFYVARVRTQKRPRKFSSTGQNAAAPAAAPAPGKEAAPADDELGLEEG